MHPRIALAVLLTAFALAWSGFLAARHLDGRESVIDRLEMPLLDLRFLAAGPRAAPDAVVIVAIDDAAIREAGAYPLPRAALARLVQAIAARGAKAIGLDILLLDAKEEASDAALAAALAEAGTVLAAAATFPHDGDGAPSETGIPQAKHVLVPLDRFRTVAALGLVNVASDRNGTPRHVPLLVAQGSSLFPAFALRMAARAADAEPSLADGSVAVGDKRTRLDLGFSLPLRFYGPRRSLRTISGAVLLRGEAGAGAVAGRAVVVGASALGTGDTFATPFDPVLPGVEVLATGLSHLLIGDGLVRDGAIRRVDAVAAVALALTAAILLVLAPPPLAAGLIVLAAFGWLAATFAAFGQGLWLAAAMPLAALIPVAGIGLGGRLLLDRREARALALAERALSAFHPPGLASRIAREPGFLAQPVAQDAAVLFLDLAGYTAFSERAGPQVTQTFLKAFHTLVEERVAQAGGLVVSFMGDGAMCVFGLADPRPDDARRALAAALDLVPSLRAFLAERNGPGDLRVGVHHGAVVVSRLGSAAHQHITATGDSVNTASRLMEVGKGLSAALVVSRDLLDAAGPEAEQAASFEGRSVATIRGRAQPLAIAYRWVRNPG